MNKFIDIRKKNLEDNIGRQWGLLSEWEKKKDLAENPTEIARCEEEISRLKRSLDDYMVEYKTLAGEEGLPVPRDMSVILKRMGNIQKPKVVYSNLKTSGTILMRMAGCFFMEFYFYCFPVKEKIRRPSPLPIRIWLTWTN